MKNKGFTLIELLAVIVILAIIALIATPIIINIINDSREESYKRSIELYSDAVRNAVAKSQLNGTAIDDGLYTKRSNGKICKMGESDKCITPEVEGTIPYNYEMTISDGNIIEERIQAKENSKITVKTQNSTTTELTRYYWFDYSYGDISNGIPEESKTKLSDIDRHGNPVYLAFDTEDGTTIKDAYICFERNNNTYCLRRGTSTTDTETSEVIIPSPYYKTNAAIIREAYPEVANPIFCGFVYDDIGNGNYTCFNGDMGISTSCQGDVIVDYNDGVCNLTEDIFCCLLF